MNIPYKIWIVDDDAEDRMLIKSLCIDPVVPYANILIYENCQNAWNDLQKSESSKLPDLIFTDTEMQNMNGPSLIELVKKHFSIAIVLMSNGNVHKKIADTLKVEFIHKGGNYNDPAAKQQFASIIQKYDPNNKYCQVFLPKPF